MIAGTIRNAVNQMQLVNDWEQKKATGDVVKKQEGMTVTSQEESMIQHFREQLERDKESSAYSQIYNKIASGQELTASEEDAIRQKDPKAYMEYKAARMEQEAYERRLERCKTKEEAQRLQVNEMNGNLAELKSIVNNPNIPKSEKLKEAQRIMGNTFRAVESFTRFVKSTEYRDLPTEEEIVETSIEKGQVAEDSNDTEMSEQLTSDTTVSVDEAAKIVNDSKRDLQLSDVHQIEKDVIEEMKDIEIKHFGEKKSSVRISKKKRARSRKEKSSRSSWPGSRRKSPRWKRKRPV